MGRKRKLNWTHEQEQKQKQQKELKGGEWSELLPDLLRLILKRLMVQDYLLFSYVCKSWRSIVIYKPHPPAPQLPWLMQKVGLTRAHYSFYSFPEDMPVYKNIKPKPKSGGGQCCGSGEGWLAMADYVSHEISIINPFYKAEIKLPHQSTMLPSRECLREREQDFFTRSHYIKKIIMFTTGPDCDSSSTKMIVAICGVSCYLAFCRVGDERWTTLENQSKDYYDIIENRLRDYYERFGDQVHKYYDIIFYNGKLYALTYPTIDVYNIDGGTCPKLVDRIRVPPERDHPKGNRWQFVESCGELLMVLRKAVDLKTLGFCVVKLEVSGTGSRPRWVQVGSLGNQVLFLSMNSLLCFSADNFPGLEGNHIYFTRNSKDDYTVGIFSMQVGSIQTFKSHRTSLPFQSPTWFAPKL